MVDPLGGARLWKRDVLGRTRVFQDEEGYERETRYDADGRIVFAEKQGSNSVETSYTNENDYNYVHDPGLSIPNVTKREQVDGVNATTAVWTDQLGRELARKRADGSRLEIVYDGHRAARAAVNDHLGNTVQMIEWTDDGFGRIGTEVGPFNPAAPVNAPVVDLDWSAAGRLVRIDAAGEVTERDYGADHGLLERERFLGLEKSFAYASPQSGNGLRLEAISEVAQAGGSVRDSTFTYDSIGRLVQTKVSTPGQTVIREINGYDALGGPTATLATTDDGGSIDTVLQQFGYDALGRRLTRSTVVDGTSHGSTSWTYHGNGVVQSVTSPSGQVVAYDYGADFDYELDTITGGPTLLFEVLTRDGAGRPIQVARPTSTTDITYDDMGRQIGRFDTFSGTVLKSWEGSYNALGQLFWERQLHDGQSWDNNFGYDGAGRLISEFNGRDNATHDYELSASGKRISTTTTDGTGAKTVVSFGYVGELLDSVDGMSLAYDDWNAVVTDQRGTQYGRDASGSVRTIDDGSQVFRVIRDAANMPVALVEPSGTRVTHWDLNPADLPVEVVTAAGDTIRYAAGVGAVFRASFGAGGAPLPAGTGMLDYNAASSLLSEGNQEVDPGTAFGAGQSPVATDRFAFARMESLPGLSDVFMARHRFYDAATGRFLSPDPLGLGGGSHRLLYAKGNPIKWNDPLGLSSNCDDPATLVAAPTIHPADLTIYIEVDEPEVETMSRSEVSALIKEISAKYAGFGDIGGSASLPGGGCGYIGCGPAGGGEGGASSFGLGAGFGGALAATQGGQPDADGGPGTLTTADDFTFDVWGSEENPEIGNFRLADEEKTKKEIREENKAKRQEQRDDKKADREERKERPAEEKKAKLDVLGWVKRLVGGAGGGGQGAAAGRAVSTPTAPQLPEFGIPSGNPEPAPSPTPTPPPPAPPVQPPVAAPSPAPAPPPAPSPVLKPKAHPSVTSGDLRTSDPAAPEVELYETSDGSLPDEKTIVEKVIQLVTTAAEVVSPTITGAGLATLDVADLTSKIDVLGELGGIAGGVVSLATNDFDDALDYVSALADGTGVAGGGATLLGGATVGGFLTTGSTVLGVFLVPWFGADSYNDDVIEMEARNMAAKNENGSEKNWESYTDAVKEMWAENHKKTCAIYCD